MKKFLKITLFILLLIILILTPIYMTLRPLYKLFSSFEPQIDVETHDINDYFNQTYLEYKGGKEADIFFNDFVCIDGYKDIAFHYLDDADTIHIHSGIPRKCTIFVLDVYYEEAAFWEVSDKILIELTGKNAKDSLEFVFKPTTTFNGYTVTNDDPVYKENTAAIFFDPTYNTIRYAMLYNYTSDYSEVVETIDHILKLSTSNYLQENWLFDYSDIAITK